MTKQYYNFDKKLWTNFDNGNSIEKKGSEDGTIIFDIEHKNGARITVEKECGKIPFAITIGIYGILFHTEFLGQIGEVKNYVEKKSQEINEIINLYEINETEQNEEWKEKVNNLIEKITE